MARKPKTETPVVAEPVIGPPPAPTSLNTHWETPIEPEPTAVPADPAEDVVGGPLVDALEVIAPAEEVQGISPVASAVAAMENIDAMIDTLTGMSAAVPSGETCVCIPERLLRRLPIGSSIEVTENGFRVSTGGHPKLFGSGATIEEALTKTFGPSGA